MKRTAVVLILLYLSHVVMADEAIQSALEKSQRDLDAAINTHQEAKSDYLPHQIIQWTGLAVAATGLVLFGFTSPADMQEGRPLVYVSLGMLGGGAAASGIDYLATFTRRNRIEATRYGVGTAASRVRQLETATEFTGREAYAVANREVFIGMSEEALLASWGGPTRINRSVTEFGERKQFVYPGQTYVYVEDGVVTSWQD